MRVIVYFSICLLILSACGSTSKRQLQGYTLPVLNLEQANRLAQLPLACVEKEYPNKLHQTLGSDDDLKSPKQLHPAFYGCFDWHSAVHGHWSMVNLLKKFPNIKSANKIKSLLKKNISAENIAIEINYFNGEHNKSWERTYGWAWLLKLAQELHSWDNPLARELESNLKPLTELIADRFEAFLPTLNYQIRVGEHPNTAFGMSFAHDYAVAVEDLAFKNLIEQRAIEFFANDQNCPMSWEPGGFDFLSPCLQEMDIMRRVLPKNDFVHWLKRFLPQLTRRNYDLEVGVVSSRDDGKLVHLDGLNFSRAWCLYGLGYQYPQYRHLINVANKHMQYSLPHVVGDSYEGGHWLGSFVIYSMNLATP